MSEDIEGLGHEIWATAQLLPEEGIEDGVERIVSLIRPLLEESADAWSVVDKVKEDLESMRQLFRKSQARGDEALAKIKAMEQQAAMDTECLERIRNAGERDAARVEELEKALEFVATVRLAYPKEHSRHLLLKMCEREAKETLARTTTGAAERIRQEERKACAKIAEEIGVFLSCTKDCHGIPSAIRVRG